MSEVVTGVRHIIDLVKSSGIYKSDAPDSVRYNSIQHCVENISNGTIMFLYNLFLEKKISLEDCSKYVSEVVDLCLPFIPSHPIEYYENSLGKETVRLIRQFNPDVE